MPPDSTSAAGSATPAAADADAVVPAAADAVVPAAADAAPGPVPLAVLAASQDLSRALSTLRVAAPVAHVYNPMEYAFEAYRQYVCRYAAGPRRIVLMGMNPGPYGMMQTGVPFGEVSVVRDWMGIVAGVSAPVSQHPMRPIQGFACTRSEVSGRRLWGWAQKRFGDAQNFFADAFVINYCPLAFLEASGRNRTPEQLPTAERRAIDDHCNEHLVRMLRALQPQWALGIGGFATQRMQRAAAQLPEADRPRVSTLLHPSPASPLANRGWEPAIEAQLRDCGLAWWFAPHEGGDAERVRNA